MARTHSATVVVTLALLAPAFLAGATAGAADAAPVKLMVLGETHGTADMTRDLVRIASAKGATGCVCPGDFIHGHDGATPSGWKEMMRPVSAPMLPAQGNHDIPWSDWSDQFPNGERYYSRDVNGVQFVSLNTEFSLAQGSNQRAWLERTLAERDPDALKVVFLHRVWWLPSGAYHPYYEFERFQGTSAAGMDALMEKHGVDLVVSGHEKNYQHSTRSGVHYLVAGGGGPHFHALDYPLPGAVARREANVVSVLDVTPAALTLASYDLNGALVERFTIDAPAADSAPFTAEFTPYNGNAWWVQTKVESAAIIARVDASVNGGAWQPLTLRSWGAWAESVHAPDGATVRFRATSTSGASVESAPYRWPDATPLAPTFEAAFQPHGGNAWWVQTKVESAAIIARVDASVNGGAWQPLELRSWGSWAASLHAPSGSTIVFRATSDTGGRVTSETFAWPSGTPADAFTVTFAPHGGNTWWVQTKVDASAPIAKMDASVNGGAWQPLELKSWGSWAANLRAPSGSTVVFRATSEGGAIVTSDAFAWPVR